MLISAVVLFVALFVVGCGAAPPASSPPPRRSEPPPLAPEPAAEIEETEPDPFAGAPALEPRELGGFVHGGELSRLHGVLERRGIAATCPEGEWTVADERFERRDCDPVPILLGGVRAFLVVVRIRQTRAPERRGTWIELHAPAGESDWLAAIEAALMPPSRDDDPLAPDVRFSETEEGWRQMSWGDRIDTFVPAIGAGPARVRLHRITRGIRR